MTREIIEPPVSSDFQRYYMRTYFMFRGNLACAVDFGLNRGRGDDDEDSPRRSGRTDYDVHLSIFHDIKVRPYAPTEARRVAQDVPVAELFQHIEWISPVYGYITAPEDHAVYVTLSPQRQYLRGFSSSRVHLTPQVRGLEQLTLLTQLLNPCIFDIPRAWQDIYEGERRSIPIAKQFALAATISCKYPELHYKGESLGHLPTPNSVVVKSKKFLPYLTMLNASNPHRLEIRA